MRRIVRTLGILGACALALGICVFVIAVAVHQPRPRLPQWSEFAIGPESGAHTHVAPTAIRSQNLTLKAAIALAYDIPPLRVVGPAWLSEAAYSVTAVVPEAAERTLRPLLQEELKARLHLRTHIEPRPYDVFVLSRDRHLALQPSTQERLSAWVQQRDAELRGASMDDLARVVQSIVGRAVINETGIEGRYDIDLSWVEDRVIGVSGTLSDRFGLSLRGARRQLDTLVIDEVRRDPDLVVLAHLGRLARVAPPSVREGLGSWLTIR